MRKKLRETIADTELRSWEISKKIGICNNRFSGIVSGRVDPKLSEIIKLSKLFKQPAGDLFSELA